MPAVTLWRMLIVRNRDFIAWVEQGFRDQGLKVDVLIVSPRMSEKLVIHRQVVEGVQAVVRLTSAARQANKVGLQLFNRANGSTDVGFEGKFTFPMPSA